MHRIAGEDGRILNGWSTDAVMIGVNRNGGQSTDSQDRLEAGCSRDHLMPLILGALSPRSGSLSNLPEIEGGPDKSHGPPPGLFPC